MKKEVLFKKAFPSERSIRKQVLDEVSTALISYRPTTVIPCEEILLAVDEALTNAMEHGNKWDPKKKILIEIFQNTTSINIKITDEGEGFTFPSEDKTNRLKPRGYGLHLIKQFSTATWNQKGNSVNLKFLFKAC
ncbi:MAG TPA: ATP-binding protein [Spirochaetota bacterium]|nr:ATP-binding protein [Spirochaetota bacterium]